MDPERLDIRSSLKALAADGRRELSAHLEPEQLVAYRAGELSAEAIEPLRDHLALCPECAELLLDLDEFATEPPPSATPISDRDLESAWKDVRRKLVGEGRLDDKAPEPAPNSALPRGPLPFVRSDRRQSRGLVYGLAASLVVVMALSSWETVQLVRRPTTEKPAALEARNMPRILEPVRLRLRNTRGVSDLQEKRIGLSRELIIEYPLPTDPSFVGYRIELTRADGTGEKIVRESSATSEGAGQLLIPPRGLAPGVYRLRLLVLGARVTAEDFEFRILPP